MLDGNEGYDSFEGVDDGPAPDCGNEMGIAGEMVRGSSDLVKGSCRKALTEDLCDLGSTYSKIK